MWRFISFLNVLVTGSAGFLGKALIKKFRDKPEIDEVLGVDILPSEDTVVCDIRDYAKLEKVCEGLKPSVIIHVAAQAYVPKSFEDPIEDATINIVGTINVLRLALKYGSDLIFTSSASVYGNPKFLPISEEHPTNPTSPYGLSKLTGEKYIQLLYPSKSTILRLSSVYGIQEGIRHGPVNSIVYNVVRHSCCYVTGDGNQTRDFIHVSDVVSAIELVMDKGIRGIFNVGTGEEHSINDIVKLVEEFLSRKFKVEYKPERPGEIRRNLLDISRLKAEGFKPQKNLKEGIKEIIDFEILNIKQSKNSEG